MFKKMGRRLLVAAVVLIGASVAKADSFTYDYNQVLVCPSCTDQQMVVSALFTTDKLGTLTPADITTWSITLGANSNNWIMTQNDSKFDTIGGISITATSNELQIAVPSNTAGFDFTSNTPGLQWVYGEEGPAQFATVQLGGVNLIGESVVGFPSTFTASSVGAPSPVPEPGSLLLLGTGTLSMAAGLRRKWKAGSSAVSGKA